VSGTSFATYARPTNETRQSWTLAYVPGRRLTNKDLYILTSSRRCSGAEEFTYNLKYLKRATVFGETTQWRQSTCSPRFSRDCRAIQLLSNRLRRHWTCRHGLRFERIDQ
jgi:hypothetical protein